MAPTRELVFAVTEAIKVYFLPCRPSLLIKNSLIAIQGLNRFIIPSEWVFRTPQKTRLRGSIRQSGLALELGDEVLEFVETRDGVPDILTVARVGE